MNSYSRHQENCSCTKCAPFRAKKTENRIERGSFGETAPVDPNVELNKKLDEIIRSVADLTETVAEVVEKVNNLQLDGDGMTISFE